MSSRALLLVAALGFVSFASLADAAAVVSRLKTEKVPLTDDKGNSIEFARANFKGPWAVRGKNADGTISVDVDGKTYSVEPMYVETQGMSQLVAPPACLDNKDTRLAATRNVGDGCTKK